MSTPAVSRARWSAAEARRVARDVWGLDAAARELPSERDSNFALETPEGRFVLKISPPRGGAEVLELQNAALEWLARRAPELPLPRLRAGRVGPRRRPFAADGGASCAAADVSAGTDPGRGAAPGRRRCCGAVGRLPRRLDAALDAFAHPAAVGRDLLWNPDRALEVIARIGTRSRDPARRAPRRRTSSALHRERVRAARPAAVPRGIIHNDANDYNVLVGDRRRRTGRRSRACSTSATWSRPGRSASSPSRSPTRSSARPDPLAAAAARRGRATTGAPAVGGRARGALEPRGDPPRARASASRRTAARPSPTTPTCWSARRRRGRPSSACATVHPRLAHYRLRAACGCAPCPQTPAIEAWLARAPRTRSGPVVAADLLDRPSSSTSRSAAREFATPGRGDRHGGDDARSSSARCARAGAPARHRPLRRGAAALHERRVRGLGRRASRAADRAPRHRHLPGAGLARPRAAAGPRRTASATTPRASTTARPSSSSTRPRARRSSTRSTAT